MKGKKKKMYLSVILLIFCSNISLKKFKKFDNFVNKLQDFYKIIKCKLFGSDGI